MSAHITRKLIFNFGFLLEGMPGVSRDVEISYPAVQLDDISLEPLTGQFRASRSSQGVLINGTLVSYIDAECARCNNPCKPAITLELDDHYYVPKMAPSAEALIIHDNGILDLGALVREVAVLSVPIQAVCRSDCQGLCMECGVNLNNGDCGCEHDDIDPRMAVLKQLLDKEQVAD